MGPGNRLVLGDGGSREIQGHPRGTTLERSSRQLAEHTGLDSSWGPWTCLPIKERQFSQENCNWDKCTTCKALSLTMQYRC